MSRRRIRKSHDSLRSRNDINVNSIETAGKTRCRNPGKDLSEIGLRERERERDKGINRRDLCGRVDEENDHLAIRKSK